MHKTKEKQPCFGISVMCCKMLQEQDLYSVLVKAMGTSEVLQVASCYKRIDCSTFFFLSSCHCYCCHTPCSCVQKTLQEHGGPSDSVYPQWYWVPCGRRWSSQPVKYNVRLKRFRDIQSFLYMLIHPLGRAQRKTTSPLSNNLVGIKWIQAFVNLVKALSDARFRRRLRKWGKWRPCEPACHAQVSCPCALACRPMLQTPDGHSDYTRHGQTLAT